jgi:hypothetical protein
MWFQLVTNTVRDKYQRLWQSAFRYVTKRFTQCRYAHYAWQHMLTRIEQFSQCTSAPLHHMKLFALENNFIQLKELPLFPPPVCNTKPLCLINHEAQKTRLEKMIVAKLVRKSGYLLESKIHYRVHRNTQMSPTISQLNLIHNLPTDFPKTVCNIMRLHLGFSRDVCTRGCQIAAWSDKQTNGTSVSEADK